MPLSKIKDLLKTMIVPSSMLVPQKAVFFDILQVALLQIFAYYAHPAPLRRAKFCHTVNIAG